MISKECKNRIETNLRSAKGEKTKTIIYFKEKTHFLHCRIVVNFFFSTDKLIFP